jgi:hypothetical protein
MYQKKMRIVRKFGSSAHLVKLGCRQRRSHEAVASKVASFHQEKSSSGKSKADEPSQA